MLGDFGCRRPATGVFNSPGIRWNFQRNLVRTSPFGLTENIVLSLVFLTRLPNTATCTRLIAFKSDPSAEKMVCVAGFFQNFRISKFYKEVEEKLPFFTYSEILKTKSAIGTFSLLMA